MALTTERQTYLLQLRRRGNSVSTIAEMLDITTSSVNSCLKGAYSKLSMGHGALEARTLELERIDEIQSSFYETAIEGDPKAAEVVFKAMDRRAKLLGLDAPEQKQVETRFQIGWIDEESDTIDAQPNSPEFGSFVPIPGEEQNKVVRLVENTTELDTITEPDKGD